MNHLLGALLLAVIVAACGDGAASPLSIMGGTNASSSGSGGPQGGLGLGGMGGQGGSGAGDIDGAAGAKPALDATASGTGDASAAAGRDDAGGAGPHKDAAAQPLAPREGWAFVSIPDWLNNDATYRDPRWTGVFEDGSIGLVDFALDAIAAERPDFVLIAGDLVNGKWGLSGGSLSERQAQVREMGERFMAGMLREFEDRHLTVYAAVGDHDVGDNPWGAGKLELVSTYKDNFITHVKMPMNGPDEYRGTTYSLRHKGIELFVIDEFEIHDGQMRVGATGTQLDWLDQAMGASTADFKFVVGHAPILPGFRARSSSGLQVIDGPDSGLWSVIVSHADLYFCGEVHDISFQKRDGVLQLITGTQPSNVSEFNYLIATVFRDRVEIEIKSIRTTLEGPRDASLDPYGEDKYTQRIVKVSPKQQDAGWQTVGTMTLRRDAQGRSFDAREGFFQSRWDDQGVSDEEADAGL